MHARLRSILLIALVAALATPALAGRPAPSVLHRGSAAQGPVWGFGVPSRPDCWPHRWHWSSSVFHRGFYNDRCDWWAYRAGY
jgi:hypothetical protein